MDATGADDRLRTTLGAAPLSITAILIDISEQQDTEHQASGEDMLKALFTACRFCDD
jgi:hypothetical protein